MKETAKRGVLVLYRCAVATVNAPYQPMLEAVEFGAVERLMPERLSGTVTFLFTDIEGSTELLRQLGARLTVRC